MMKTGIVWDDRFLLHLTGPQHPETPARYRVIKNSLLPYVDKYSIFEPRLATPDQILTCHTPAYFETVKSEVDALPPGFVAQLSTGDANISRFSFEAALLAAGAVITAVDAVIHDQIKNAFCLVRPPGHHATQAVGMGFCLFNNAAIGARYALTQPQVKKVLIVDWDVHHGNGTQEIFESDSTVFYFSTHQEGIYPGTGKADEVGIGTAIGTNMNCPIEGGKDSSLKVLQAFRERLVPAMELFQPDFVIISCGFDAHLLDPLGGFDLNDRDFIELTQIVLDIAKKYACGRVVSVLEGGYSLEALSTVALAHTTALAVN